MHQPAAPARKSRRTTCAVLGLFGFFGFRDHIASPQGIRSLLERELPYRSFSETAVPLHLVCADLVTGDEVVISEGDLAHAVIASTAIPGLFPPVQHHGRYLVDGAVVGTPGNRDAAEVARGQPNIAPAAEPGLKRVARRYTI